MFVVESLEIEFVDQVRVVSRSLSFGRSADLCVDEENRYMHRVCGQFQIENDVAWLHNMGSVTRLSVLSENGTHIELVPGGSTALGGPTGSVNFIAGPSNYEINYRIVGFERRSPSLVTDDPDTVVFGAELTNRELDFIVAFARQRLAGAEDMPTYAEVAETWGVSPKTVDNTLQGLRRKLKSSGARDIDSLESLVSHLLAHGKVTRHHLEWAAFDNPEGPRSAGQHRSG